MAAIPAMLEHDRKQAGWSVGQAAWHLGVTIREYRGDRGRRTRSRSKRSELNHGVERRIADDGPYVDIPPLGYCTAKHGGRSLRP
jgi:hypothetical protein